MTLVRRSVAGIAATAIAAGLVVGGAGVAFADPTGYPPAPRAMGSMQSRPYLPTLEGGAYAVDGSDLYVADAEFHRVIKIVAGEDEPIPLPFTGLHSPAGVAVENGNVYVADTRNNRVLALLDGRPTQVVLPFDGLSAPSAIAVEDGTVYVADTWNGRILALREGDSAPTVLPFGQLDRPVHLAAEDGSVYVAELSGNRVVELPSGTTTPVTLPFLADHQIAGLIVDNGDVYFLDFDSYWMSVPFGSLGQPPAEDTIRKVSAGESTPVALRFAGFRDPAVLSIENGSAYLVDGVGERVPTPLTTSPTGGSGSLRLPFGS
ncbi:SMP-30/Gluconolactonase/LRE-like region domain-containing protein [Prescottella defluvii]